MTAQARTRTDLPLVAFTADLVADLTGLSVSQLQRWDRTGFFQPWRVDPNRRRAYSRIYSLPDVIALRAMAELREAGASFAEVKRHRNLLEPGENGDWPAPSFHVVGTRLFVSRDEALAALRTKRAQYEPVTINLDEVAARVEQGMRKLAERRREEIGQWRHAPAPRANAGAARDRAHTCAVASTDGTMVGSTRFLARGRRRASISFAPTVRRCTAPANGQRISAKLSSSSAVY
jgi:DNA-binding transcriptional MerR regulator